MKYHNLVYGKHHDSDRRAYLYELPLDMVVSAGDRLCVQDRRGEHIVTAFADNWLASARVTEILCVANGGYYPPAKVVGTVRTVTIMQELVDKFHPDENEEVNFPWA